ncbi:hypothetical protein [Anaerotalea alkaliphila]|uniref:Uncharacterized protein n=1 Tax=Anaerotalea alkaliphila TaxID=2662126 RepID=A0A7X5HW78_9FIRM|nr:hypothetical protein [Anaerotalea alkaliphila]NDL67790.1 hypothetical protein [Anaerotalea alkaliphila]
MEETRRKALLEEYKELSEARMGILLEEDGEDPAQDEAYTRVVTRMQELEEEYRQALPLLPVSRCPFTGEVLEASFDVQGLGGLWWLPDNAVRKDEEFSRRPSTFFALDGALHVGGPVEAAPFVRFLGPDRPGVVGEVLSRPEVKAVLSTMRVGEDTLWWVAYFAHPMVHEVPRINDYGADRYQVRGEDGFAYFDSYYWSEEDYDFELEHWVREGKLLWIKPGDESLGLRAVLLAGDRLVDPALVEDAKGMFQILQGDTLAFLSEAAMSMEDLEDGGELDPELLEALEMMSMEDETVDGQNGERED